MKRFCNTLVAAVLAAALLIPGAMAAGDGGVTYDLSVNGSHDVTVATGETVTVTFAVTSGEEVTVSTLQNEIYYDANFFELVSCEPVDGSAAEVADQQRVNGDHVVQVAYWGPKTITDSAEFAVIKLKVIAVSGSSTVASKARGGEFGVGAGVEAYDDENGAAVDIILLPVTVSVALSGSSGSQAQNSIVIREAENGTVTADQTTAPYGGTVTVTPVPNAGYLVDAVTVSDSAGKPVVVTDNGDGTYSFIMPGAEVTVEVGFYCPSEKFTDFVTSAWYHEAVDYVVINGYFIGTSKTTFEPDTAMTRAMFVQVLANMSSADMSQYTTSSFTDVDTGAWYAPAVEWAAQNGVVLGVGEGLFAPEQVITREQMAVMLYRYASYLGLDVSGADAAQLDRFADAGQVSDWAEEAVAWAVSGGIINGTDKGLEPLSDATRAQVAQILMNFDLTK